VVEGSDVAAEVAVEAEVAAGADPCSAADNGACVAVIAGVVTCVRACVCSGSFGRGGR
jgi:hypothetical protein